MRILISFTEKPNEVILNQIKSKGVKILKVFKFTNTIGAEIEDESILKDLMEIDGVKDVRITEKARILVKDALVNLGAFEVQKKEFYGEGILVSVIDSGMNLTDPALAYSVMAAHDFTGEGLFDPVGYGTLISKLIKLTAPAVYLLNAKIVDVTNEADEMDLMDAIE